MDKPIVIYDESRGKILAKYVENFGRVCEVDVTDQALQAVFRYLMAHGLSLAEHCEYEVDSNKVIEQARTIEPVKHGKWLRIGKHHIQEWQMMNKCSVCGHSVTNSTYVDNVVYFKYCPYCRAEMENDEE